MKKTDINVKGTVVYIIQKNDSDYISLTDIARHKDPERSDYILQNWMRLRSSIEFIGLWEVLHNPNFNSIEFDGFKNQAGANSFSLTPKHWIEATSAIGIVSKAGRYGGTYAHRDIAFEFASWISAEFYRIHTDAIKEKLTPPVLIAQQINQIYADDAKQWRDKNPNLDGNIRDFATIEQLVVLSNLESINSVLIHQGIAQDVRLKQLNGIAVVQRKSLLLNTVVKKITAKA